MFSKGPHESMALLKAVQFHPFAYLSKEQKVMVTRLNFPQQLDCYSLKINVKLVIDRVHES